MVSVGRCEIGLYRKNNEDSIFLAEYGNNCGIFAVADGMGGHKAGEIASKTAVQTFAEVIEKQKKTLCMGEDVLDTLIEAIADSNRTIYEMAKKDEALAGM